MRNETIMQKHAIIYMGIDPDMRNLKSYGESTMGNGLEKFKEGSLEGHYDRDFVLKAIEFTKEVMKNVSPRKFTNKPAYSHPLNVLESVKQYAPDDIAAQVAAVLHDVIEDTEKTKEDIRELFGEEVMDLVVELTSNQDKCKRVGKASYLSEKMNTMTDRALLIKLCDRLDNVSDFDIAEEKWRNEYRTQTETILTSLHPLNEKQQEVANRIWDIINKFK